MADFAEENRKLIAEGYPRVSSAGLRGAKQVAREQLGHTSQSLGESEKPGPWACWRCNQLNAFWATECGRCGQPMKSPATGAT